MGNSHEDDRFIQWWILSICVSSVITTGLYLLQRCGGNCLQNVVAVLFQYFAAKLEIREETFNQVTNQLTFPRMLQQLELQSFRVLWMHDANAQTGDYVQWGWFRLPTRSYMISIFALFGVTHYVWIPSDLQSMVIVGPVEGIATLIDLSNVCPTSRLNQSQVLLLR